MEKGEAWIDLLGKRKGRMNKDLIAESVYSEISE
jgi:hypothetical protein